MISLGIDGSRLDKDVWRAMLASRLVHFDGSIHASSVAIEPTIRVSDYDLAETPI